MNTKNSTQSSTQQQTITQIRALGIVDDASNIKPIDPVAWQTMSAENTQQEHEQTHERSRKERIEEWQALRARLSSTWTEYTEANGLRKGTKKHETHAIAFLNGACAAALHAGIMDEEGFNVVRFLVACGRADSVLEINDAK
jgi:hypothetical protein